MDCNAKIESTHGRLQILRQAKAAMSKDAGVEELRSAVQTLIDVLIADISADDDIGLFDD